MTLVLELATQDLVSSAIRIPVVLKEHVVLIIIRQFLTMLFMICPGYRQERIKVSGCPPDGWNGSYIQRIYL